MGGRAERRPVVSAAPKVGDTVWIYDDNRRAYAKGGNGAPIYGEGWRAHPIMGETRTSWLLLGALKVDKATGLLRAKEHCAMRPKVEFSREAVDADIWREDNRSRIADAVKHADCETLKKIDALLIECARTGGLS